MTGPIPKNIPYRNRRLLDLAHGINECQIRIPTVCTGYTVEGCEPAHSNWAEHGKGAHRKADDCFFAASCHACHAELDQGKRLSRELRQEFWARGHFRTMRLLWLRELIKVA